MLAFKGKRASVLTYYLDTQRKPFWILGTIVSHEATEPGVPGD